MAGSLESIENYSLLIEKRCSGIGGMGLMLKLFMRPTLGG